MRFVEVEEGSLERIRLGSRFVFGYRYKDGWRVEKGRFLFGILFRVCSWFCEILVVVCSLWFSVVFRRCRFKVSGVSFVFVFLGRFLVVSRILG